MKPEPCSVRSLALGEPLFATASETSAWLLIEQPGPWGHAALVESRLDREVGAELEARTKALGIKALLVKRAGGRSGRRRCFLGRSDQGAAFLDERLFEDDRELLDLGLEALARGERPDGGRPVDGPLYLVCTNSRRDACCARLGRPVAKALAAIHRDAVWECSHLGGHRFAANLVCLPDGLWFGRLAVDDAVRAAGEYDHGRILLAHYRGRSSLVTGAQAADYFVRERTGLRGVDDLTVESVDLAASEVNVTLRNGGHRFQARLRSSEAEPARSVSCREDKLDRPAVWALVALEEEAVGRPDERSSS
jgi:hypothetical protein